LRFVTRPNPTSFSRATAEPWAQQAAGQRAAKTGATIGGPVFDPGTPCRHMRPVLDYFSNNKK
jgi:hypothetical protein